MVDVLLIKKRTHNKIDLLGESFSLNGVSQEEYKGLFGVCDNSLVNVYLDDVEALSQALAKEIFELIIN